MFQRYGKPDVRAIVQVSRTGTDFQLLRLTSPAGILNLVANVDRPLVCHLRKIVKRIRRIGLHEVTK